MKFLRATTLLALSILAVRGEAGTVSWNVFESSSSSWTFYDGPDDSYGTKKQTFSVHYYDAVTPEVAFAYNAGSNYKFHATAVWDLVNCGQPNAYWVLASAGETLESMADYQSHELIFDCLTAFDFSDDKTGTIYLSDYTETFYLALLGEQANGDNYWGWVELEGNLYDGLSLVSSALTTDGPLIVGDGLAYPDPTPEPTSGLLLLLGTVLLALRRRN